MYRTLRLTRHPGERIISMICRRLCLLGLSVFLIWQVEALIPSFLRASAGPRVLTTGNLRSSTSLCCDYEDSEWSQEKEYRCLWRLRRKLSRELATPLIKNRLEREREEERVGEERAVENRNPEGLDFATLLSVGFVAVAVTVLRFGGRAAFVSFLGLDFMVDADIKSKLDEFLSYFQRLGTTADFALFLAGWTVAKTFCIDILTILLAVSSGILFGGFWQGTIASVVASSIASSLNFQIVRQFFGDKVYHLISHFNYHDLTGV